MDITLTDQTLRPAQFHKRVSKDVKDTPLRYCLVCKKKLIRNQSKYCQQKCSVEDNRALLNAKRRKGRKKSWTAFKEENKTHKKIKIHPSKSPKFKTQVHRHDSMKDLMDEYKNLL